MIEFFKFRFLVMVDTFLSRNTVINGKLIRANYLVGANIHVIRIVNPFKKITIEDIEEAKVYFDSSIAVIPDFMARDLCVSKHTHTKLIVFRRNLCS